MGYESPEKYKIRLEKEKNNQLSNTRELNMDSWMAGGAITGFIVGFCVGFFACCAVCYEDPNLEFPDLKPWIIYTVVGLALGTFIGWIIPFVNNNSRNARKDKLDIQNQIANEEYRESFERVAAKESLKVLGNEFVIELANKMSTDLLQEIKNSYKGADKQIIEIKKTLKVNSHSIVLPNYYTVSLDKMRFARLDDLQQLAMVMAIYSLVRKDFLNNISYVTELICDEFDISYTIPRQEYDDTEGTIYIRCLNKNYREVTSLF